MARSVIKSILLCALLLTAGARAEYDMGGNSTTLTVLPTIDTSGLNLAQPMQQAMGQLLFQTGMFRVQFSSYSLSGFTEADLKQSFQRLSTDQFTFSYLESGRISVFLFDKGHMKEFIVVSLPFDAQAAGSAIYQTIQYYLQQATQQALYQFNQEQYQPLPGTEQETEEGSSAEKVANASASKQLFLEYAASQKEKWHLGANLGMARMGAASQSQSVIDIGLFFGRRFNTRWSAELGFDFFAYALMWTSGKYKIPILKENYVSMNASLNFALILSELIENRGFSGSNFKAGQPLVGPGLDVVIPLLGAQIRGGVKFLIGGGSILMGHYALVYTF